MEPLAAAKTAFYITVYWNILWHNRNNSKNLVTVMCQVYKKIIYRLLFIKFQKFKKNEVTFENIE